MGSQTPTADNTAKPTPVEPKQKVAKPTPQADNGIYHRLLKYLNGLLNRKVK